MGVRGGISHKGWGKVQRAGRSYSPAPFYKKNRTKSDTQRASSESRSPSCSSRAFSRWRLVFFLLSRRLANTRARADLNLRTGPTAASGRERIASGSGLNDDDRQIISFVQRQGGSLPAAGSDRRYWRAWRKILVANSNGPIRVSLPRSSPILTNGSCACPP